MKGLEIIINILSEDRGKVWTVIEVYNLYKENNGTLDRKSFVQHVIDRFEKNIIILHSPGISSILVFKEHATQILRIEKKEDDFSEILVGLGKQIAKECKDRRGSRVVSCTTNKGINGI